MTFAVVPSQAMPDLGWNLVIRVTNPNISLAPPPPVMYHQIGKSWTLSGVGLCFVNV